MPNRKLTSQFSAVLAILIIIIKFINRAEAVAVIERAFIREGAYQ
jgi:hypothetical protein